MPGRRVNGCWLCGYEGGNYHKRESSANFARSRFFAQGNPSLLVNTEVRENANLSFVVQPHDQVQYCGRLFVAATLFGSWQAIRG